MSGYNDIDIFAPYVPFAGDEETGVIITTIIGAISLTSVLLVLIHIFVSHYQFNKHRRGRTVDRPSFLQLQIGKFIVCLLVSDLIQGISGVIQFKWALDGGISEGTVCKAQGIMLQAGDNGNVVWNAIIAIHTFSNIVLSKPFAPWFFTGTFVAGWAAVALLTFIGPSAIADPAIGEFYGRAKAWCFISPHYAFDRIMVHCLPMALSAVIIFTLYFLVFLNLRGHLVIEDHTWTFHWKPTPRLTNRNKVANRMLWYPMVYALLCAPITATRISALELTNVPNWAWIFSMCFLYAMGTCDAIIYSVTRNLGPTPSWLQTRILQKGPTSSSDASDVIYARYSSQDWKSFDIVSPTAGQFSPNLPSTPLPIYSTPPSTANSVTRFGGGNGPWSHMSKFIEEERESSFGSHDQKRRDDSFA